MAHKNFVPLVFSGLHPMPNKDVKPYGIMGNEADVEDAIMNPTMWVSSEEFIGMVVVSSNVDGNHSGLYAVSINFPPESDERELKQAMYIGEFTSIRLANYWIRIVTRFEEFFSKQRKRTEMVDTLTSSIRELKDLTFMSTMVLADYLVSKEVVNNKHLPAKASSTKLGWVHESGATFKDFSDYIMGRNSNLLSKVSRRGFSRISSMLKKLRKDKVFEAWTKIIPKKEESDVDYTDNS